MLILNFEVTFPNPTPGGRGLPKGGVIFSPHTFLGLDYPDHVINLGPAEVAVVKKVLHMYRGEMYRPF